MQALLQAIENNAIILTPNKRLATRLQTDYAKQQSTSIWQTATILPINTWLEQCWQTLLVNGKTQGKILLTPLQSQALWQQIINQDSADNLLNLSATSRNVQSAWNLLQQWCIDLDDSRLEHLTEQQFFKQWAEQFQQTCQQADFLDPAQLCKFITQAFSQQQLPAPNEIVFACFTELQPNIKLLVDSLQQLGCQFSEWQPTVNHSTKVKIGLADSLTELETMANWAKQTIKNNPNQQIACVIPELNQLRNHAEEIFYKTFAIDQQITNDLPFNFSSGIALSRAPIIAAGLNALQLAFNKITLATINSFLTSVFFVDAVDEINQQALFATELVNTRQAHFNLKQIIKALESYDPDLNLLVKLKQFQAYPINKQQTISAWAKDFSHLLHSLGWPGKRTLTSNEYQASQRWLRLLTEFTSLELVYPQLNFYQAFQLIKQLATQTLYQAESTNPKVHILGLLEAAGMPFDAIWIMGLDNKSWPTSSNPNPFIPVYLQRQLNMPHCSPERELAFCQSLTQQFINSTALLITSFATQQDEGEQQASPLLENFAEVSLQQLKLKPIATSSTQSTAFESFADSIAPAIQPAEKIRGGTGIIKQQAACPFRAFAEYRLKAKRPETIEHGISAQTKGILLHKTLELLWQQLKSQQNLLQLTQQQLDQLIEQSIAAASKQVINKQISATLLQLEQQRLMKLINKWLAYEKQRPSFKVVATEQWQTIKLGQLVLRVQLDRVDLDETTQQQMLIDYKTGKVSLNDWFGYRPNDPQLLLYTVSQQQPVSAIAFAQLRVEQVKFQGIQIETSQQPDCRPLTKVTQANDDWHEQLTSWRKTIYRLANEFSSGEASVDPKNLHETCKHCHLQSLCRINENESND